MPLQPLNTTASKKNTTPNQRKITDFFRQDSEEQENQPPQHNYSVKRPKKPETQPIQNPRKYEKAIEIALKETPISYLQAFLRTRNVEVLPKNLRTLLRKYINKRKFLMDIAYMAGGPQMVQAIDLFLTLNDESLPHALTPHQNQPALLTRQTSATSSGFSSQRPGQTEEEDDDDVVVEETSAIEPADPFSEDYLTLEELEAIDATLALFGEESDNQNSDDTEQASQIFTVSSDNANNQTMALLLADSGSPEENITELTDNQTLAENQSSPHCHGCVEINGAPFHYVFCPDCPQSATY